MDTYNFLSAYVGCWLQNDPNWAFKTLFLDEMEMLLKKTKVDGEMMTWRLRYLLMMEVKSWS